MIRRPPRSTLSSSSAASDVYKRQGVEVALQQCHGAAGHAEVIDETLLLQLDQRVDRTTRCGRLVEGDPFGVVQVQQLDVVEAEALHALLERVRISLEESM